MAGTPTSATGLRPRTRPRTRPAGWNAGHLLLLLLGAAVLWFGAGAVRAWRQPPPDTPPAREAAADRTDLLAVVDPFFPQTGGAAAEAPITALALSLHGLRNDSATGRGSAIISGADGVQTVYAVGDTIGGDTAGGDTAGGATLVAIERDHVLLDHGGARESLWLDSGEGGEIQRFDPMAFDPMPIPDADGQNDEENLLPASDAPAPAAGAAVLPAVAANEGGMR